MELGGPVEIFMDTLEPTLLKAVTPALHAGETIEWVGRPARVPRFMLRLFQVILGIFALIGISLFVTLLRGEPIMHDGEVMTLASALPPTLLTLACLFGFPYLWVRQHRSVRYILTTQRALIYFPKWGASWSYTFKDGWARDYTDPEYSPISGGYFTPETHVSITKPGAFGDLRVHDLNSKMSDAKGIGFLKRVAPEVIGDMIYDPSNLLFYGLENPKKAEREISMILEKFQTHHS